MPSLQEAGTHWTYFHNSALAAHSQEPRPLDPKRCCYFMRYQVIYFLYIFRNLCNNGEFIYTVLIDFFKVFLKHFPLQAKKNVPQNGCYL